MFDIEYVIFDFDGVVADTETVFAAFDCNLINAVLRKADVPTLLCPMDIKELAGFTGEEKLIRAGKIIGVDLSEYVDDFSIDRTKKRRTLFKKHNVALGKNIKPLIDKLDGNYALATNKISIKLAHDLKMIGIDKLFPNVVACDPPMRRKPEPDIIIEAIKLMDAAPEKCAYIGDNINDMKAALAANVTPIGFIIDGLDKNKIRINDLDRHGAKIVIDDFNEIMPYIR